MQLFIGDATMFFFLLFFAHENMKKPASKVAHNRPKFVFFSNANRSKSSPNLNSCSTAGLLCNNFDAMFGNGQNSIILRYSFFLYRSNITDILQIFEQHLQTMADGWRSEPKVQPLFYGLLVTLYACLITVGATGNLLVILVCIYWFNFSL